MKTVPAALMLLVSALAATPPPSASAAAPPTSSVSPPSPAPAECPAPAQLAGALNALLPGLTPAAPTVTPLPLASGQRLGVAISPEGDVRVDLVDAQGEIVLHRVLPAPPRGRLPDCPALAETIALIVDRYLHDVGYEAPPLPPPTPRPVAPPPAPVTPTAIAVAPPAAAPAPALWMLGLAGSARRGDAGGFDSDGDLAVGVEATGDGPHWGGRLSAGYAPAADARWSTETATLRRLPVRLGVYLGIPAGPGQLEPGLGVGADILLVSATGPGAASGVHTAPSGDLALGYAIPLAGPLYLRLLLRAALAIPYKFETLAGAQVWGTPRVYGEGGVELGVAFR
jgi:hypothetical protein